MQEALLHFIWKHQLLEAGDWRTTEGESVRVFRPGLHNQDAGPDFTEALLAIGKERWMGSIEIHCQAREWLLHGHQHDAAYNNVILHVVWEGADLIQRADGTILPVFELKPWVREEMLARYYLLWQQAQAIPCEKLLNEQIKAYFPTMLDRCGIERLELRTQEMAAHLDRCKGDWEQAFWCWLASAFGLTVNKEPMEQLASQLNIHILHRFKDELIQLEALLLGQAGFLQIKCEDAYLLQLQSEFQYLSKKLRLPTRRYFSWKFMRMRPGAFPSLRLAQLAMVLHQSMPLFQQLIACKELNLAIQILSSQPSTYWQQHYRPGDAGKGKGGRPGEAMVQVWLINALIPAMFLYGRLMHQSHYEEKAIYWLESLPPEQNKIIHLYSAHHIQPQNALQSQGMIELHKHYCKEQRCLDCMIGSRLLMLKPTKHAKTG
ncbi:MAG: DUF2851 family protein [Bacteroidia bacterium]